jgi:hypothetical protein
VVVPAHRPQANTLRLARPTGFEPAGTHLGFRFIQVEGAEAWEARCLISA